MFHEKMRFQCVCPRFLLFFEDNDWPMNKDEDIFNVKTYNYDRMSYMSNAKF